VLPSKPFTEISKVSENVTIQQEKNTESKFFEWIGIFFLALSIWVWRKELKITSIGPLSGSSIIEQRNAEEVSTELKNKVIVNKDAEKNILVSADQEMNELKKQQILEIIKEKQAVNQTYLSNILNISRHAVELFLYQLAKEGKVRQDGFPLRTVYTLSSSIENLAIDKLKEEVLKNTEIMSDRRYLKIQGKFEIDAILKSNKNTYLIEIKFIQDFPNLMIIEKAYRQLLNVANAIKEKDIILCILFITQELNTKNELNKLKDNLSFDSGEYQMIIKIFSISELLP